jgi:hypothetical protein
MVELRRKRLIPPAKRAIHLEQFVLPITNSENLFAFPGHTEHNANKWMGSVQGKI